MVRTRFGAKSVFSLLLLIFGVSQASIAEKVSRTYVDEDYGFSLEVPDGWTRANPSGFSVPGEVCRTWSSDGTANVVVFMQFSNQAPTPSFLLETSADAVKTGLAAQIREQEVRQVAGMQAMWLVFSAKGTGGALDGKGEIPTSQHWVAIPREKDVIVLLLTAPDSNFASLAPAFKSMLGTLKVHGSQTDDQKRAEKVKE